MHRLLDYFAPDTSTREVQLNRIKKSWSYEQCIEVAKKIGLFTSSSNPAAYILCHLLRNYRNLVHPNNGDMLKMAPQWDVTITIEPQIAKMLKTALDIVLTTFYPDINAQITNAENQVQRADEIVIAPRIIYPGPRIMPGLASPGLPVTFDDRGIFHPLQEVKTTYNTSPSTNTWRKSNIRAPTMGSTTPIITTIPNEDH